VTGMPGCGKTTLIKKVASGMTGRSPVGFYTAEIRRRGKRVGFELVDLDGKTGCLLAHVEIDSPHRVGKYHVDIAAFEKYLEELSLLDNDHRPVFIDEIGKMECLSGKFVQMVRSLFSSDKTVVASVALKGKGIIEEIKRRKDVVLFEVTTGNRDSLARKIKTLLNEVVS